MKIKFNELGRSMLETLCVLAVIGVLSVSGISGYQYAMTKYQTNDIINSVNMRSSDIWHRYQQIPLPNEETNAFPEWETKTSTGFPIMITSHPDVAFRIIVDEVPERICKDVLNMHLNDYVKGLKFVQVNDVKYINSNNICLSDRLNKIVFTSFLNVDGGYNPNTNGMNNAEPCVEDADCHSKCAEKICNSKTMICDDQCPEWNKPVRLEETCECVECVKNSDCKFKGDGYICNELEYKCSKLEKQCKSNQFRTQNGACIDCDNGSNFIVLKDGEPYPFTSDTVDGYTMCQQCANSGTERQYGVLLDDETKAYCSFMCTAGYSYQSLKDGCVSCADETPKFIAKDDVSKEQCTSCPNHAWYSEYWFDYYNKAVLCQKKVVCGEDEFVTTVRASHYTCAKCSSSRNSNVGVGHHTAGYSDSKFYQYRIDKCNNCPERDSDGNYSARWFVGNGNSGSCAPKCEQPITGSEADTICKTNPSSEKCKRKWQNASGACFDCDAETTSNNIKYGTSGAQATDAELARLCLACGREVQGNYCILPKTKDICGVGKILGKDGNCYPCNNETHVEIESDALSGCLSNCKKSSATATDYVLNGTVDTRRVYTMNDLNYCALKCSDNQINQSDGKCVSCGNQNSLNAITPAVVGDCNLCQYREIYGNVCAVKTCPTSYYKNHSGTCKSCSEQNPEQATWTNELILGDINSCNTCGNRVAIKRYNTDTGFWCTYINPGQIGLCNSKGNQALPVTMNETLVEAAQPYINSQHDGEKFRDHYGYCRNCTDSADYIADEEQCLSCKNRRWSNNTCMKGLCEEKLQFLSGSSCLSCSNVNKPIDPSKDNLCSSCENRRQLEIGTPDTTWSGLCVEECTGTQWQDIDGNCLFCSEGGDRAIGTDTESRRLCNDVCKDYRREEAIYSADGKTVIGYKCVEK